MHLKRWLTALVLIPVILLILLKGGRVLFATALLLINGMALWEFLGMLQPAMDRGRKLLVIFLGSLMLTSFCLPTSQGRLFIIFFLVMGLFILFLFYLTCYEHIAELAWDLALSALGLLYLPLLLGHFLWLRLMSQGEWWILWLLLVICSGDTLAFYVGKFWGEKKFYPRVSPGKTWAGTLGGLAANLGVGLLAGRWLLPGMKLYSLAALALSLGFVGLLGDLFESMLKRQARVKDSSSLLPGHGGILDRLDSLLFTAPALLYSRLFILNL
jgi:phosphatidate cytidylyltransferase|uniref:Phosphatidate cytidylyltransferase n=1 Tax=Desulfobacca acetoxidans TaxID=60893 RepID=A0A7C5AKS3_9BACT